MRNPEICLQVLRVVHINSYDGSGGAARAADRLHLALIQEGVHSDMAVNVRREPRPAAASGRRTYIKSLSRGPLGLAGSFILRAIEYLAVKLLVKPVKVPFSLPFLGKNIHRKRLLKQADIIHLHWVSQGFLTPGSVRRLQRLKVPIVWTMHDSAAFTGGCHVRYGCEHFHQKCGNCQFLKHSGPRDFSNYFWEKKAAAYGNVGITLIAPSNWMAGSVRSSSLLKDKPLEVIPNA
ncbi:MAG TPA: glycosyltransferase, partial [Anseongella sp.]|nr:glycosyltransferase [Anseongella sp.]